MSKLKYAFCLIVLVVGPVRLWAAGIRAQIVDQVDSLHLEFFDVNQWDYKLEKRVVGKTTVVEITVPAIAPSFLNSIRNFKGDTIKSSLYTNIWKLKIYK